MTDSPCITFGHQEGIGLITLNRPHVLNALNYEMLERLSGLLKTIRLDDAIKAVIITGAGDKAFSAGADIEFLHKAAPLEVREMALMAVSVNEQIENLGKPVIAAINGYALGGGLELAESCMLRIAARHARLGHPEVRIGVIAGWGGTTRLPRLIGKGRATALLLTGDQVGAEEGERIGLINVVCEKELLLQEAGTLVKKILAQAPLSVTMTWEAIHRGLDLTVAGSAALGADYFGLLASSEDFREGTRAFLEKSPPAYRNR
ncbi:MAG: enoyl-CoA hydratase [Thermodesulfovibrio sp.]|nr:enoyl-CoA hydratase [Thermodesulfovibrio sp.]